MEIIIPCAGQSTRFPNMRPKYLLCDYKGQSMIQLSAEPYILDHNIHIIILQEHDEKYQASVHLKSMFGEKVNIIILPNPTIGPADTVYQALSKIQFTNDQGFMVKDCDSIFTHYTKLNPSNRVFVDTLDNQQEIRRPSNKSYVGFDNLNNINFIAEKKIISNVFCVGGYQFKSTDMYKAAYESVSNKNKINEIYISTVIDYMLSKDIIFKTSHVKNYTDLGTFEDWQKYNNKKSYFVDIDGTIVENQSLHGSNNYETWPRILENNVATLLKAKDSGSQIIFTTSRPSRFRAATQNLLNKLGFSDCQLLMDMHHAQRILINDYAPSNPWPSAVAINIKRNDDNLDQLLKY